MHELPSSIEAYLEEAGFSGTEILILRRLMDGEPLTIRQLGAKTGKSTGVLDQAMKKLMKKNIIKRTLINDTPKYSLDSLEAVVEWMQEDMEQKREMLLRRHQNFESFVTSLETGSKRPDIEYFEGESGIKQAYIKLLNGPGEILHYLPVQYKEEEDPLRAFRVQYFRERQIRKMFSRVLAHDTVLGHRYQSRDAFEYRKTVLVPEKEYPFTFEKIITGDRIACIDHKAMTACVIRYPELADVERTLFEAIWRQVQMKPTETGAPVLAHVAEPEKIALSTEAMSQVREFFLGKKSAITFLASFLLAALITAGATFYNKSIAVERIRENVVAIASTAAIQINPSDIEEIRTLEDIKKPSYERLVEFLFNVKSQNKKIKYAYVFRPNPETSVFEFVADAEAFIVNETEIIDLDKNGLIDDFDEIALPGVKYDVSHISVLNTHRYSEPIATEEPYIDQWGFVYSGYAPIRNEKGEIVGVVAIDMEVSELQELGPKASAILFWFILLFALFLMSRFIALNRSIFYELSALVHRKKFWALLSALAIVCAVGWATIEWKKSSNEMEVVGQRMMAIAATAVKRFENEDLNSMNFAMDMRSSQYQNLYRKLNEIRSANKDVRWVYILRPTTDPELYQFIADADSNYFLDESFDYNLDKNDSSDEVNVWPGMYYSYQGGALTEARIRPSYSKVPETDQWGTYITGAAPIVQNGELVGILGIDYLFRE